MVFGNVNGGGSGRAGDDDAGADDPRAGRRRRRRRDGLLQARPVAGSEFKLALRGHPRAPARTPGIDPRDVDGFASYSNDRNDPSRLAAALGCHELRFSNMQWGGGGGGGSARGRQRGGGDRGGLGRVRRRLPRAGPGPVRPLRRRDRAAATRRGEAALTFPYGLMSPAQMFAMRVKRFMHDHGVRQEAQRAIALASYAPRPEQPARGHVRPAARPRRPTTPRAGSSSRSTSSTAAWRTTAPPRSCSSPPSAPATCAEPPALRPGRRPRAPSTATRRAVHNAPEYAQLELHHRGAAPLRDGRPRAEGRRRGPELRELHRRRADEHRRARLLHAGGGQRLPHRSRTCSRRAAGCRSTPAAATSPSATCTGSG